MDPQQQQHQHAHLANAAAWQVPPHPAYMTATPPMQHPQQAAQQHPAYHQYQQHPGMMEQQHYPLSHAPHHMSVAPPVGVHAQGYGMPPHEPPRGAGSGGRRSPAPYRGSYRDRSYSPPPRHRRTPSPRGGYRDSRGYDRDMDYRGHDRGYDRGYDRSDRGYDRGHSRYDRGYDRGYDRDYDRGYGGRSYGHRARSPPRRSRTVLRGTKEDRLASKTLYVGNIPYSFREPEVEEMFKRFGTIVKVTVVLDQYTGRNKGFAFVEYEDRKNAEEAMEKYNGFDVEGRRLKLDWDIGLNKKDIKPPRLTGTTENNTAETSPQPQTRTITEASTPAEGESKTSSESTAAADSAPMDNAQGAGVQTQELHQSEQSNEHEHAIAPSEDTTAETGAQGAATEQQEQQGQGQGQEQQQDGQRQDQSTESSA